MTETPTLSLPEELAKSEHLPTIPGVAVEVLRLTADETSSINDLATALAQDPALAGKILKVSNSGLFGVGSEVTTLERATMVLGLKTVKLMSLSFSLVASLPTKGQGNFNYAEYWERCVVCAVASRAFANRVKPVVADQGFLVGLLAQLGQLAIQEAMPERYADVVSQANDVWPTAEHERPVLGFTSPEVGAALLESWSIPEAIWAPVLGHQDPAATASDTEDAELLAQIVHCAWLCADLFVSKDKGTALDRLVNTAERFFEWTPEDCTEAVSGLEEQVRETAMVLECQAFDRESPVEILRKAQEQLVQVSLGVATEMHAARTKVRDLTDKATTDALTGLPNRAAFDEAMEKHATERMNEPLEGALGLLMIDIDHFKALNDTYGHPGGDEVLRQVAARMRRVMRPDDIPARYGGEEFAIIMPNANSTGLRALAERLRAVMEDEVFELPGGKKVNATISLGGALTKRIQSPSDIERLIGVADRYLYQAKNGGRNQAMFFPGDDVTEGA